MLILTFMIHVFTNTHFPFPDDEAQVNGGQGWNMKREPPGDIIANAMTGLQLVEPMYFDLRGRLPTSFIWLPLITVILCEAFHSTHACHNEPPYDLKLQKVLYIRYKILMGLTGFSEMMNVCDGVVSRYWESLSKIEVEDAYADLIEIMSDLPQAILPFPFESDSKFCIRGIVWISPPVMRSTRNCTATCVKGIDRSTKCTSRPTLLTFIASTT